MRIVVRRAALSLRLQNASDGVGHRLVPAGQADHVCVEVDLLPGEGDDRFVLQSDLVRQPQRDARRRVLLRLHDLPDAELLVLCVARRALGHGVVFSDVGKAVAVRRDGKTGNAQDVRPVVRFKLAQDKVVAQVQQAHLLLPLRVERGAGKAGDRLRRQTRPALLRYDDIGSVLAAERPPRKQAARRVAVKRDGALRQAKLVCVEVDLLPGEAADLVAREPLQPCKAQYHAGRACIFSQQNAIQCIFIRLMKHVLLHADPPFIQKVTILLLLNSSK